MRNIILPAIASLRELVNNLRPKPRKGPKPNKYEPKLAPINDTTGEVITRQQNRRAYYKKWGRAVRGNKGPIPCTRARMRNIALRGNKRPLEDLNND